MASGSSSCGFPLLSGRVPAGVLMTARRTFRGPAALPGELQAGSMGWRAVRRFCRRRHEVRRQVVRTGNGPDSGLGGSLISQIVPAGGDPRSVVPEKVRAREGPLFSAVRGRGKPATGTLGTELRSPLLGLISAQGMSFGGGCGFFTYVEPGRLREVSGALFRRRVTGVSQDLST